MRSRHSRMAILLALTLTLVALTPALAHAAPPRASMVASDAYEPDDTTATAKALPALTHHTFTSPADQDWSYIDIDATGTPILTSAMWFDGYAYPIPQILALNPDGSLSSVGAPALPFGGLGLPYSFLARAPHPGRYFVNVMDAGVVPYGGGSYQLYEAKKQILRIDGSGAGGGGPIAWSAGGKSIESVASAASIIIGPPYTGDRYATAAEVSRRMWPAANAPFDQFLDASGNAQTFSPKGCILATGRNFADALAAGAWIAKSGAPEDHMPILLTDSDWLNYWTFEEIIRLSSGRRVTNQPFTVYIVGGPLAVSTNIEKQLGSLTQWGDSRYISKVVRIGGANRFETAALIGQQEASSTTGIGDTAFIVNAWSYADALSAGPVAAAHNAPVLLVNPTSIPSATASFLQAHPGITRAVIVGGPSAVDTSVADALAASPFSLTVTRVAGANRYETSRRIAEFGVMNYGMFPASETLVTGSNFPDGLAAAGISAFQHSPVLLTPGNTLSSQVASFFAEYPPMAPSYLIGGTSAISSGTEAQFDALRPPMIP